jgi:dienelactone hydrolase
MSALSSPHSSPKRLPPAPPGRELTLDELWEHLYASTPRPLTFTATTRDDWLAWRATLTAKLRELLGPDRPRVPLRPETLERKDCGAFVRERIVFDTEPHASATAYLFLPKRAAAPRPAVLCLHGHGPHGKDNVAGVDGGNVRRRIHIWRSHYDYAASLARRGYVCLAADGRGWGDRSVGYYRKSAADPTPPFGHDDPCGVHFVRAQLFGISLLWLNVWDDMRGLDLLASRPEVDAARIGAMGLSFGGTRALYLAALDKRVRAATVACYLTSFEAYALRTNNCCGAQTPSGLLRHCELADVAALVAPRALRCESGIHDGGFPIDAARKAFETVARCYAVAGVGERCEHAVFEGGHRVASRTDFDFFERWLRRAE